MKARLPTVEAFCLLCLLVGLLKLALLLGLLLERWLPALLKTYTVF